jgi:hypothetical protein
LTDASGVSTPGSGCVRAAAARAGGTGPDIISRHELQGDHNIAAHFAAYRSLERSPGISPGRSPSRSTARLARSVYPASTA